MADYIDRQATIDAFLTELTKRERKNLLHTWSTVEVKYFITDMMEHMPSAQPEPIKINIDHELTKDEYEKLRKDMADAPIVLLPSAQPEVIRCKDCKYYDINECTHKLGLVAAKDENYCSYGECREEFK